MLAAHPASSPSFDVRLPPSTVHGLPSTVQPSTPLNYRPPSTILCSLFSTPYSLSPVRFVSKIKYRPILSLLFFYIYNLLFLEKGFIPLLFLRNKSHCLDASRFRLPGKERSSRRETAPAIFARGEFERLVSLPHHSIRATINL
jgi:hypothetical protein